MTLKKGFYQQRVLVLGERGSSLIEVLVSMGIGLMLSLFAVYFSAQIRNQSNMAMSKGGFSCHAHLATVMDRIRALGHANEIATFHPWGATPADRSGDASLFSMSEIVSDAVLWPSTTPQILANASPVAYNALLIKSSMRALNALFNNAPAGCAAQDISSSPAASLVAGDSAKTLADAATSGGVATTIRIQTYDLASGGIAGCEAKPLYIYPAGAKPLSTPSDPVVDGFDSTYFAKNANYRNNLGFQVSLETSVTIGSETVRCAATERFAYQQDMSRPANPVITVAENSAHATNAHENNWNVRVNYPGGEKGVMLFCRDRSRLMPTNYACYRPPASPGNGPGTQPTNTIVSVADPTAMPAPATAGPSPTESDSTLPASMSGSVRPNEWGNPPAWVPCEQLTVCGRARNTSSTNTVTASNGAIEINNTYDNLRSDCVLRVEVVAMDTAGNLNAPDPIVTGYHPTQIQSSSTRTRVSRPTCGMLCSTLGVAHFYNQTSGSYWQGGQGCCNGHIGCGPGLYWNHGTSTFTYFPQSMDPAL